MEEIVQTPIIMIYTDGTPLYPIPGFDRYLASRDGRVFSKNYNNTGKIKPLVGKSDKDGYIELLIRTNDGKRKYVRKHRLIALAFIPNPDNLQQVNHKNGDTADCEASNLEWCTQSDNVKHSHRQLGWDKSMPILQFGSDGNIIGRYSSTYEAEEKTGIKHQNIWACLKGKQRTTKGCTWKYESEVMSNVVSK